MPNAHWTCPRCGETFTTKSTWHSCGKFSMEALFAKSDPPVRETYEALEKAALEVAPFHVIPQKTRIVFQLVTRCAGGTPYKSYLRFRFMARRVIAHPKIVKVESYAKDQHDHSVKLFSPTDVDDQIREWLRLSTEYGERG